MWWEKVSPKEEDGPRVRWGHTCNFVPAGCQYVYVFGGYGPDQYHNDVYVFDSGEIVSVGELSSHVNQTWRKPIISGNPSCPRSYHTCTAIGTKLFIFGGTNGKGLLNDLYVLYTINNTWIKPCLNGKGPDKREGHAAICINNNIYIFGGSGETIDMHEEVYYNDVFMLDTDKMEWTAIVPAGTPPSSRDSPTSSAWGDKILIIGGEDSDGYLSDVHMLHTEKLTWEEIKTKGEILPPRSAHTTISIGNHFLVFGGFGDGRILYEDLHVLNIENKTWRKVPAVNKGPGPRFSVAGDCVDKQRGKIVIFRGCNQSLEAFDDLFYLHTEIRGAKSKRKEICHKRELKKKCLEESTSVQRPGLRDDNVIFTAEVKNTSENGYAIETNIQGKLLRGFVFTSTGYAHINAQTNNANETTVIPVPNEIGALNSVYRPSQFLRPPPHLQRRNFDSGGSNGSSSR